MLNLLRWLFSKFNLVVIPKDEFESLAAGQAEKLRKTISALEKSYDMTLESLAWALDRNEGSSGGHSKRVTAYSIAIARAMGMSREEIRVIARGAFLQDIGKMAIPEDILRKSAPLNEQETALMRQHCDRGYRILKQIPFLASAAEIVLAHHENFDGTGYPRGLKEETIPLGARIVAVANMLDSITSHSLHGEEIPLSAAYAEISRCSGTQFDPKIVNVFLTIPERVWEELKKSIDSDHG